MSFEDFKLLYIVSCLFLGLVILSPTLALVVRLPGGESFSELWVLGSGGLAENYPFNVVEGEVYNVSLGVGNRMGGSEYYLVYVKVRNQTEVLPDAFNGTPSVLEPVFEYRFFLSDGFVWERKMLFSFEGVSFEGNFCKVSGFVVGGQVLNVDKLAFWDQENRGFYLQLFFELWRYDSRASAFRYHNRFVGLWLNFTMPI